MKKRIAEYVIEMTKERADVVSFCADINGKGNDLDYLEEKINEMIDKWGESLTDKKKVTK